MRYTSGLGPKLRLRIEDAGGFGLKTESLPVNIILSRSCDIPLIKTSSLKYFNNDRMRFRDVYHPACIRPFDTPSTGSGSHTKVDREVDQQWQSFGVRANFSAIKLQGYGR